MEPRRNQRGGVLRFRCQAFQDGDRWVAECLELGIALHADTFESARDRIHLAIKELLADVVRLKNQGERVRIVPVHNYYWKLVRWEIRRLLGRGTAPQPSATSKHDIPSWTEQGLRFAGA